ncbi:MAG: PSD1 domain-containing protein [Acidobacteria bacterium]|nr:PSD1 domain-containing protein [Acidobacteriota bacterium]
MFVRALATLLIASATLLAQSPDDAELFEKKVRPLLVAKCQMCHSTQMKTAELDLSSAEGFVKGGASGPIVNAEHPEQSMLLKVISYDETLKMPPMGKLSADDIAVLKQWVDNGAHWPGADKVAVVEKPKAGFTEEQKTWWAFQPVADPVSPAVKDEQWARSPIDHFLLAKIEEKSLKPEAPADKATLLRRATYDLTGMPPTQAEIEAFLADESSNAFEKVVDRLLASPRYGERWGRQWLNVARYADSTGNDEDHRYPYAYRYRDYVIEAFNNDLPFDQFVREQIAGDLMPAADGSPINERGIIATGFLALGPKAVAQQDKMKMLYDVYDEQVDVVSKAVLGMTLSCARCHDHKFDPLLQRDYYAMAGVFANTRSFSDPSTHVSKLLFTPLVPQAEWDAYEAEQENIRKKKFALDNLADIELEQHVEALAPSVGEYMLAAYQVYAKGADAASAAAKDNLDAKLVERWAAYLKPGAEVRAHLADWDNATDANRLAVAQKFEDSFNETLAAWYKKLRHWRKEADRPAEEITMGIPSKPGFEAGENRFFFEAALAKNAPFSFRSKEDKEALLKPETQQRIAALEAEVAELEKSARPTPARACAVEDKPSSERIEQTVLIRGDYHSKGDPTPLRFPSIIAGLDQSPVATDGSGRLELANWMASKDNPLTPRVIVNRIWQGHFGDGLVRTPDNFGKTGELPSHPDLLDWLATRFIEDGWSIKKMHKRIMLSAAYQQSSDFDESKALVDPENRLLSRFSRRRLDVEEIRDGLLTVDGTIDLSMGGTMQEGFGTDGENSNDRLSINPDDEIRRTIYLPLRRANLPALLNLFDFGDAATPMGKRAATNVAPQALFMMNSKFVAERARNLAEQLLQEKKDNAQRVRDAYLRTLNRAPGAAEVDNALTYISAVEEKFGDLQELDAWESYCRILMASNEFIYVD